MIEHGNGPDRFELDDDGGSFAESRNRFEADARARKVAALVTQIDADLADRNADPLVIAQQVAHYTPSDWVRLARRAGINAPSLETIAQVCRRFVRRAEESLEPAPESGEYESADVVLDEERERLVDGHGGAE